MRPRLPIVVTLGHTPGSLKSWARTSRPVAPVAPVQRVQQRSCEEAAVRAATGDQGTTLLSIVHQTAPRMTARGIAKRGALLFLFAPWALHSSMLLGRAENFVRLRARKGCCSQWH